ncbi:hypothetical protein LVD17_09855 [Fulvivirga ulvae]|uniref:hypothetical protein n=1 Tax=Fulvivirga ulvae TaxID=2904245 RepID=UPI001F3C7985|nr:hypothetical protein [Fulvivirga ulvae]UII34117.1 hypothetical protein LVD17_09855 [Fulvivirga ulvae]
MDSLIFVVVVGLAVAGNIFYYQMKHTLKVAGYKVNYFYGHFTDLLNMYDLIKNEKDKKLKRKYSIQLARVIILIVSFIVTAAVSFFVNQTSFSWCIRCYL